MWDRFWVLTGVMLVVSGAMLASVAVSVLGLLVVSAMAVCWLWARYSLLGVRYTRTLSSDQAYAGDTIFMSVSAVNSKPLSLSWLEVRDEVTPDPVTAGDDVEARRLGVSRSISMRWYERAHWTREVRCSQRGYYTVGPPLLRSGDPFGFYERERWIPGHTGLVVYPRLLSLDELPLDMWSVLEGSRTSQGILQDPFNVVGARPYEEGDTLRRIHWRASARETELQSKVWLPTSEPSVTVFLDLSGSQRPWESPDQEAVERAISAAATVAHQVHELHWALGLQVNGLRRGTPHRAQVSISGGEKTFQEIMRVLALVAPGSISVSFSQLLSQHRGSIRPGTVVIVITALRNPEVDEQVRAYRSSRVNALFVDVSSFPAVVHSPQTEVTA